MKQSTRDFIARNLKARELEAKRKLEAKLYKEQDKLDSKIEQKRLSKESEVIVGVIRTPYNKSFVRSKDFNKRIEEVNEYQRGNGGVKR